MRNRMLNIEQSEGFKKGGDVSLSKLRTLSLSKFRAKPERSA